MTALDHHALDERLRHIEQQRRALDAELAVGIAVAHNRQLNTVDGHHSMKGYLRASFNWSNHEVARWRSLARMIDAHPDIADAWMTGRIGLPQTIVFADTHANPRVRERLGEFVPILLDDAEQLAFDDFRIAMKHFVTRADTDGAHDARDHAIAHRDAHANEVGGSFDLHATGGDALTTAEMIKIFEKFTQHELDTDLAARRAPRRPQSRTRRRRRTPRPGPHRRPTTLLRDRRDLPPSQHRHPTRHPSGSVGEHRHRRRHVRPHARHRRARTHHDFRRCPDRPVHRSRRPSDLLHDLMSGAGDLPTDICHVDHNNEWVADNGRTDQNNANIQCARHNRWKNLKRWKTRHTDDGNTYTIRADGTIILPVGARTPTFSHINNNNRDDDSDDARWWQQQNHPDEIARHTHLARQRCADLHPTNDTVRR